MDPIDLRLTATPPAPTQPARLSLPVDELELNKPEQIAGVVSVIDAILEADATAPRKQRHTAQRIFERLRDEHGFAGGYTTVKDYVRQARIRQREVFVPLAHPPGNAQVDFGEAVSMVDGVATKVHLFCMDLPHSDASS